MKLVGLEQFPELCQQLISGESQLIDVRAPIEFEEGAIPHSLNSPILNTEERALVGTAYKKSGPSSAIELGHQLVSGEIKAGRIKSWQSLIKKNPKTYITCFRGGLRSKLSQAWLEEAGTPIPRIQGGYKSLRRFLNSQLETFTNSVSLLVVSGATGSGKTKLLRKVAGQNPLIDLELAANHRGSAFGRFLRAQPNQTNFENTLAFQIIEQQSLFAGRSETQFLIEDESRLIGRCVQPGNMFVKLRESPVIFIEESLEQRVLNTYEEYILHTALGNKDLSQSPNDRLDVFKRLIENLDSIQKRLGGLRHSEIKQDLVHCQDEFAKSGQLEDNKIWIRKLLEWYYDPMYLHSLEKRSPQFQFKGSATEVLEYLLQLSEKF